MLIHIIVDEEVFSIDALEITTFVLRNATPFKPQTVASRAILNKYSPLRSTPVGTLELNLFPFYPT